MRPLVSRGNKILARVIITMKTFGLQAPRPVFVDELAPTSPIKCQ